MKIRAEILNTTYTFWIVVIYTCNIVKTYFKRIPCSLSMYTVHVRACIWCGNFGVALPNYFIIYQYPLPTVSRRNRQCNFTQQNFCIRTTIENHSSSFEYWNIHLDQLESWHAKREKRRSDSVQWQKSVHRQEKKATWQHKNAIKNFEYTTIADRLRTVSGSNNSHPTGVVKAVYGRLTFLLTAKVV